MSIKIFKVQSTWLGFDWDISKQLQVTNQLISKVSISTA